MPSTLALVRNMFLDRQERRYAMAAWAAMASVGAAVGPIVGGWVIDTFSWQAAFLMNIPVMLLLLMLGPFLLPESRNPDLGKIDISSVVLSFVGMIGVVYAMKTLAGGKDITLGIAALTVGLTAITLFVRRQLTLPAPLLDVRLFKVRYFRGAVIADLLSIFAMVGALVLSVLALAGVLAGQVEGRALSYANFGWFDLGARTFDLGWLLDDLAGLSPQLERQRQAEGPTSDATIEPPNR